MKIGWLDLSKFTVEVDAPVNCRRPLSILDILIKR
jgi:hypothetical protein